MKVKELRVKSLFYVMEMIAMGESVLRYKGMPEAKINRQKPTSIKQKNDNFKKE